MKLKIRNVRSIIGADIDLDGLIVLAGQNGAGKSTVQLCLSALLAGERGAFGKSADNSAAMIRHGEKEARAILEVGEGRRMVKWSRSGDAREEHSEEGIRGGGPKASMIALGRTTFMGMSSQERAAMLAILCKTSPTEKDFVAEIKERDVEGADVSSVWSLIKSDGWDAAAQRISKSTTELKGRWQEVTGNPRWGSKIGESWGDDIDGDEAEMQSRLDELTARLVEIAKAGHSMSDDEREDAEREAAIHDKCSERLAWLEAENRKMLSRQEEIDREKKGLPSMSRGLECPCCGEVLALSNGDLVKLDEEQERESAKRMKELNAEADGLLETGKKIVGEIRQTEESLARARKAKDRLAADTPEEVGRLDIDWMKEEKSEIEARLSKIRAKPRAAALHEKILSGIKLAEILGPEGLRKRRLSETLDAINIRLSSSSEAMGLPAMRIDMDMDLWCGNDRYVAMSESERWRMDIALQVEFAKLDGSSVICVDRLDMRQPDGPSRGPILKLLSEQTVPVVALMTAGVNGDGSLKAPDISRIGLGRTLLLTEGHVTTLDGEIS